MKVRKKQRIERRNQGVEENKQVKKIDKQTERKGINGRTRQKENN